VIVVRLVAALVVALASGGCELLETATGIPPYARDLTAQLECDGEPQRVGGELGQIGRVERQTTASIYPWLESLKDLDLPLTGYVEVPKVSWEDGTASFVRFVNTTRGRVKAVVIMSGNHDQGPTVGWRIVAFRACAGEEFDPANGRTIDNAPWFDASGNPIDVQAFAGPGHCEWQSTTWLRYKGRLYVRDPLGVMAEYTTHPFVAEAEPPGGLTDTGYRSWDRALLTSTDAKFVWVRTPRSLERWSGVRIEPGCM
jgi:hypothetical protein